MRLATFTILAGLALGASAAPTSNNLQESQFYNSQGAVVAYEVPGTEHRVDPTSPEPEGPIDPTWDDTADTFDEMDEALEAEADSNDDVHLEAPLNNDAHDPLLEEIEPVDALPLERDINEPVTPEDPFRDPLP